MSAGPAVIVAVIVFFGVALAGAPIAFALALAGAVGLVLLGDLSQATATLGGIPFASSAKFSLILIPMFVLMGLLILHSGVAEELYAVATRMFRRVRGGVGLATVAACAAFGAVTGSSIATVATIGKVSIREMRAQGYSPELAAGIVASGGTLGVLIPPSVVLVLYGIMAEVSVGALLIAGIIPGILSATLSGVYIYFRARRDGIGDVTEVVQSLGATGDVAALSSTVGGADGASDAVVLAGGGVAAATIAGGPGSPSSPGSTPAMGAGADAPVPYGSLWYIAILFSIVIGGIYTGIFTAGEAGAIGALTALVMVSVRARRRGTGVRRVVSAALAETTSITSMTFALLVGGAIFTYFFVLGRIPYQLTEWIVELPVPPTLIVIAILLVFIPLGMVLDSLSILLITIPLAAPVVSALGFDLVWFGILVVKMIEIGLVTPPVGLNVFVVAGVSDEVSVEQAFRGIGPFVVVDLVTTAILFAFPSIVTFLPNLASN